MNNRLSLPPPRADEPSSADSAAAPTLDSSLDSSDSYNGDDARRFLQKWRAAKDHYSEATWENGQLENRLKASQAALLATKEEANAARVRLAESDTMVVGKRNSKKIFVSISTVFVLIAPLFP